MRYFYQLNFQHIMLYLFPTLIFIVILALALGRSHFGAPDSEERKRKILHVFPEGIEDRNAPFPLFMSLVVIGTVVWGIFYILMNGLLGVKI